MGYFLRVYIFFPFSPSITSVIAARFATVWKRNDFLFKHLAGGQKKLQDVALGVLHNFTKDIIRNRRKQLISNHLEQSIESGKHMNM